MKCTPELYIVHLWFAILHILQRRVWRKFTNNHKTSRAEEFAMALLNKIFLNLVLAVKIDFDALASAVAFDSKIEAWDMWP